jgi:hypothetical protein
MLNWRAFDRAIDAGYRYTAARLKTWDRGDNGRALPLVE